VHEIAMTALACVDPTRVSTRYRGGEFLSSDVGRKPPSRAPDTAPLQLGWLAADAAIAERRSVEHATVVREQVNEEGWTLLRERAAADGVGPDAATYLPVHPWQWEQRILALHAGAITRHDLVWLGTLRSATCRAAVASYRR
jgi:hypothetical protein